MRDRSPAFKLVHGHRDVQSTASAPTVPRFWGVIGQGGLRAVLHECTGEVPLTQEFLGTMFGSARPGGRSAAGSCSVKYKLAWPRTPIPGVLPAGMATILGNDHADSFDEPLGARRNGGIEPIDAPALRGLVRPPRRTGSTHHEATRQCGPCATTRAGAI
jgi:hypothetical protein